MSALMLASLSFFEPTLSQVPGATSATAMPIRPRLQSNEGHRVFFEVFFLNFPAPHRYVKPVNSVSFIRDRLKL